MPIPRFILGSAIVFLGGCSSLCVSTDYDSHADFSKLHTWAWYRAPSEVPATEASNPRVSPLTLQRVRDVVAIDLIAKGFALVPKQDADVLVAIHAAAELDVDVMPYAPGWVWDYGWGPVWDGLWGPPAVYAHDEGILIVDVIQNQPSRRLLWRGTAHRPMGHNLSAEKREERIREAVDAMLTHFPPS